MLKFPEIKRRLHKDGYYYSSYEDIIEYSKAKQEYDEELKLFKEELLKEKIKNDPEGNKWYKIKCGTKILVSHSGVQWQEEKFSERIFHNGEYLVRIYWDSPKGVFYSSHEGGIPNTFDFKYAKLINE